MTIPHEYRFRSTEVSIRRDPRNGDVILSEGPGPWNEIFAALDAVEIPADFLSPVERKRRLPTRRAALDELFNGRPSARRKRK